MVLLIASYTYESNHIMICINYVKSNSILELFAGEVRETKHAAVC